MIIHFFLFFFFSDFFLRSIKKSSISIILFLMCVSCVRFLCAFLMYVSYVRFLCAFLMCVFTLRRFGVNKVELDKDRKGIIDLKRKLIFLFQVRRIRILLFTSDYHPFPSSLFRSPSPWFINSSFSLFYIVFFLPFFSCFIFIFVFIPASISFIVVFPIS